MTDAALAEPSVSSRTDLALEQQLRVLSGRARGGSAKLTGGETVEVGYGLASDIVVRDPAARALRLRLTPRQGVAELQLLEGEVELLGHVLRAPADALLPAFVPLIVGGTALAFGEAGSSRWPEAERLLVAARPPEPANDDPAASALARLPSWRLLTGLGARLPRQGFVLPALAVVMVLSSSALVARTVEPWIHHRPTPAEAQHVLAQAGFPSLFVRRGSNEGLVVQGLLGSDGERARLEALIETRSLPLTLAVQTDDSIGQGVADVFRTNGYDASVRAAGLGIVAVRVRGGDPSRIEDVRRIALRDVRGLRGLQFDAAAPAAATSEGAAAPNLQIAAADEPGKRVTAVVSGSVAYVATADGSRYFPGATLPSGGTVVAIAQQDVAVEKDGAVTHLKF